MPAIPVLDTLPPVFTRAQALQAGASKRQLYEWRDDGKIDALGRGLFLRVGTPGDPDLIELAARAPNASICLRSALARHDLTDEIPDSIHVAIPRTQRPPTTTAPASWHRFDPRTFAIGRKEIEVTDGCHLGLYTPSRTIIDTFRMVRIEGREAAVDALRRWLRRREAKPAELLAMAKHFPKVAGTIRSTLETLL